MDETPKKEHTHGSPPNLTGRKAARSLRLFRNDNNSSSDLMEPLDLNRSPTNQRHTTSNHTLAPILKKGTVSALSTDMKKLELYPPKRLDAPFEDTRTTSKSNSHSKQRHHSEQGHRTENRSVIMQKEPELSVLEPLSSATYIPKGHEYELITLKEDVGQSLGNALSESASVGTVDKNSLPLSDHTDSATHITSSVKFAKNADVHEFSIPTEDSTTIRNGHMEDQTADDENENKFALAVELTPFNNKVGGHTAIFRFSRKAVCKALVNRENFWYEIIEKNHVSILKFMPKYIGVLNVRYTTLSEDPDDMALDPTTPVLGPIHEGEVLNSAPSSLKIRPSTSYTEELPPEVNLIDNKHIIPESMWDQYSSSAPSPASSFTNLAHSPVSPNVSQQNNIGTLTSSPGLSSLGSTTVNKKLQEQVLQEVFRTKPRHQRNPLLKMRSATSPKLLAQRAVSGGLMRPHRLSTSSSDLEKRPVVSEGSLKKSYSSLVDLKGIDHTSFQQTTKSAPIDSQDSAIDDDPLESPKVNRIPKLARSESDSIFLMDDEEGQSAEQSEERQMDEEESLSDVMSPLSIPVSATQKVTHRLEMFILLEDLTSGINKPSVIDLKMGTRQYGVEATAKKKSSQRQKCAKTTSRRLGVRLCGLQIWDQKTGQYISKDKYFGRNIKAGFQFAASLARFLYDGLTTYSVLVKIPKLIDDINALGEAVEKLAGYRLYGSSLLLMYDGENLPSISMHIIDFAQCVTPEIQTDIGAITCPPKYPTEPDRGYLRGLESIKFYLKAIFKATTGVEFTDTETARAYINENQERFSQVGIDWLEEFDNIENAHKGSDIFNEELDEIPPFALDDSGYVSE